MIALIIFSLPLLISAQPKLNNYNKLKNGTFYLYPPNFPLGFTIIRKDTLQEEINLKTNDTSYWKVSWQNDYQFEFKFIRKNHPISDNEKSFYIDHIVKGKVLKVENDYYTFKAGFDSINNPIASFTDTMWFKAK